MCIRDRAHTKIQLCAMFVIVLQLIITLFQIGFDKRHKATDTVAEIANELNTFKDHQRIFKRITRSIF